MRSDPIRLCGDYSHTLNQIIDADSYTIPTLEQILHRIAGASRYSVLDLKDAYLQVILSKESQLLTCVSHSSWAFCLPTVTIWYLGCTAYLPGDHGHCVAGYQWCGCVSR